MPTARFSRVSLKKSSEWPRLADGPSVEPPQQRLAGGRFLGALLLDFNSHSGIFVFSRVLCPQTEDVTEEKANNRQRPRHEKPRHRVAAEAGQS